ncbi:hypothetical protein JCM11251_002546 [Rhodosporidiobolus azoricus]
MSLHRRLSLNGPSPSSISVDPLYAFPRLSEPSYPAPSTPSAVAERGEGEVETTSSSEELTLAEETEMLRRGNEARERRFSAREARLASDDSFGSASLSSRLSLSRHPSLASPLPLHRRRDIRRPDPAPRPHYHALAAVHSHQSYQASLSPTAALTDSQHRAEALSLLESLPSPILDALASELRQFALEQQDRNRRKRLERERAVDRVRALRDEEQDSSGTLGTANTEEAGHNSPVSRPIALVLPTEKYIFTASFTRSTRRREAYPSPSLLALRSFLLGSTFVAIDEGSDDFDDRCEAGHTCKGEDG